MPQGQCIELLCQHNQSLRKPLKLVATVAVVVEASLVTLTITGNQVCTFGSGRALPFRGAKREYTFGLQVPSLALAVYFPKLVSLYYLLSASPGCLGLLLGVQHLDVSLKTGVKEYFPPRHDSMVQFAKLTPLAQLCPPERRLM